MLTFFYESWRDLSPLLNGDALQKWSRHIYTMIAQASLNITATPQHAYTYHSIQYTCPQ